ncbi:hypothetical protein SDC9_176045 [bioreactor metagenome]|uniref:Uncharacterized protein n=1 Tax=bioreactor metagenome TaxID=1076179 RepID=A0A645GY90_9ZZZZ
MTAILKWFEFIQTNIVANGIYQLDRLTKKNIMSFMSKENPTNESTTLYQFGIHEIDNKIYGYAYRSTNDYSSEQLPYSIGVKPTGPFETDDNLFDFLSGLLGEEALQKVMLKLKEYDDQLETQNTYKVGIGGLLEVCVFEKYSLDIKIYDIFPDYRSVHEEILKNCQLGV